MRFAQAFLMYCGIFLLAISLAMPTLALAEGLPGNGGDEEDAQNCQDPKCGGCQAVNVTCDKTGGLPCSCSCDQKKKCKV